MPWKYLGKRLQQKGYLIRKRIINVRTFLTFLLPLVFFLLVVPLLLRFSIHQDYLDQVVDNAEALEGAFSVVVFASVDDRGALNERAEAVKRVSSEWQAEKIFVYGNPLGDFNAPRYLADALDTTEVDVEVNYTTADIYSGCSDLLQQEQQQFLLISHELELTRSLYICEALGLEVLGYLADTQQHEYGENWFIEAWQLFGSVWQVHTSL